MGKDKIKRFLECDTFKCMVQPEFDEIFNKSYKLKGNWGKEFFGNDNPIVLELGCGRGEYTFNLAKQSPDVNFIGIDIKGARMWRGAKSATEDNMTNIAFLRTRIEFINSFFGEGEISEIWITFPDPQLKKTRVKKRLTGHLFLEMYSKFLKPDGKINLKTDCLHLHQYTAAVCEQNKLNVDFCCDNIYNNPKIDKDSALLTIQTTYEEKFLKQGMDITYIKFDLGGKTEFVEAEFPADELL